MMDSDNNEQDPRPLLLLAGIENIRRMIYDGQEYWSVVDTIGWLTDATNENNASKAWNKIRSRMIAKVQKKHYHISLSFLCVQRTGAIATQMQ